MSQQTTVKNKRPLTYVNGVNKTNMKKVAEFWFGKAGFLSIRNDSSNETFLLIVDTAIQDWQITQFEKFWGVKVKRAS